eukprot:9851942-Alexandrium_andersonii.AAC.1
MGIFLGAASLLGELWTSGCVQGGSRGSCERPGGICEGSDGFGSVRGVFQRCLCTLRRTEEGLER